MIPNVVPYPYTKRLPYIYIYHITSANQNWTLWFEFIRTLLSISIVLVWAPQEYNCLILQPSWGKINSSTGNYLQMCVQLILRSLLVILPLNGAIRWRQNGASMGEF